MNWEVLDRQSWGESSAADWADLIPDLSATLQAALDECVASEHAALYVEMWPDTGRFISYPAAHPVGGELAERDTDYFVQLSAQFWITAWDRISSESGDSSAAYEQLNQQALATLTTAYDACQTHGIVLYAFEYEGTEGITVITKEAIHDHNRDAMRCSEPLRASQPVLRPPNQPTTDPLTTPSAQPPPPTAFARTGCAALRGR